MIIVCYQRQTHEQKQGQKLGQTDKTVQINIQTGYKQITPSGVPTVRQLRKKTTPVWLRVSPANALAES